MSGAGVGGSLSFEEPEHAGHPEQDGEDHQGDQQAGEQPLEHPG